LDNGARWIAFTDADTIECPELAERATRSLCRCDLRDVSIEDWSGYPAAVASVYLRTTAWTPVIIHGANSDFSGGVSGPGGIPALKLGEDVALVSSCSRAGRRPLAGPAHVATSARWESTIEGGFCVHVARPARPVRGGTAAETLAA